MHWHIRQIATRLHALAVSTVDTCTLRAPFASQLGVSLFDVLSQELHSGGYSLAAHDAFFRETRAGSRTEPSGGCTGKAWAARAVLLDMEPKAVQSALQAGRRAPRAWSYEGCPVACMQSGAGNNWAQGYHGQGPAARDAALEGVRQQVCGSACGDPVHLLVHRGGG